MEITMLENTNTNVVASPMPTPEDAAVEMAQCRTHAQQQTERGVLIQKAIGKHMKERFVFHAFAPPCLASLFFAFAGFTAPKVRGMVHLSMSGVSTFMNRMAKEQPSG